MISKTKKLFLLALFLIPVFGLVAACDPNQGYCPLAPIDQLLNETRKNVDVDSFIPGAIKLFIGIAGGLAVIRIVIGGVQYVSSDAWGKKSDARDTILHAILGLLLAIGAYTILNTVNPKLVDFNLIIPGQRTGGPIDPGTTTQRTAEQLGCGNCEYIDAGEFTISPSACSNDPCYAQRAVITTLGGIKQKLMADEDAEPRIPFVAWQITKAFPPRYAATADPNCFKPNNSDSGKCIHISLPNSDIAKVKRLLDSVIGLSGWTREYRVASAERANVLRAALGGAQSAYFSLIRYRAGNPDQNEYLYLGF